MEYQADSGLKAHHRSEVRTQSGSWKEKEKGHKKNKSYTLSTPPLLTAIHNPFYQGEQQTHYCDKMLLGFHLGAYDLFRCIYDGFYRPNEPPHLRVKHLFLPTE